MKLTAWITFFFLAIFLTKVAMQTHESEAKRDIASEGIVEPIQR